jgi:hypothetical protein
MAQVLKVHRYAKHPDRQRQAARVYRTKEASNNISNCPGDTIDIPQSSELQKTPLLPPVNCTLQYQSLYRKIDAM